MRDRKYYRQNRQQLIDHNSPLVQNDYALNMLLEIKVDEDEASSVRNDQVVNFIGSKTRISNDIHFIMCQSCFWCASYINRSRLLMSIDNKCPLCHDSRIESMPISYDEIYRLNYNRTSGLVLKFLRE
jgi:hypothetical protein